MPHGELTRAHARPRVRRFIRGAFMDLWAAAGRPAVVVEKTCVNPLRVPFVDAVLPKDRFVHLLRDGRAVVPLAMRRWRSDLEIPGLRYYVRKSRYVPLRNLPVYAGRFSRNRVALRGDGKRMSC